MWGIMDHVYLIHRNFGTIGAKYKNYAPKYQKSVPQVSKDLKIFLAPNQICAKIMIPFNPSVHEIFLDLETLNISSAKT